MASILTSLKGVNKQGWWMHNDTKLKQRDKRNSISYITGWFCLRVQGTKMKVQNELLVPEPAEFWIFSWEAEGVQ